MPTYDYNCPRCGDMEISQSMRDAALTVCPVCRSRRFRRQVSAGVGVIFRGEGFWETDYNRSADYQSKAKAESAGSTASPTPAAPAAPASTSPPAAKTAAAAAQAPAAPSTGSK